MNIGTYLSRAKLTGRLYFQRSTSAAFLDFGNIALVKNEPKIDRAQQLWKSGGVVQVGHEEPGKVDLRWSFKGDEHIAPVLENLNLARAGTSTTQAAASGVVKVLVAASWTSASLGLNYDLGKQNVSAVVITNGSNTLVSGTDYVLDAGTGMVRLISAPDTASTVSATFNCAQVVTTVYTQITEAFVRGTARIVLKDLNDASPRQVITFSAELATTDWGDNDGQKFNQFGLLLAATAAPTIQDRWLFVGNSTQQVEADYFQNRINAAGGVMTSAELLNLASFIYQLKTLGLWEGLVELWPLRSGQNIGAGTSAIALRGNDGTLVSGPTWGVDGMSFPTGAAVINTALADFNTNFSRTLWVVFKQVTDASNKTLGICGYGENAGTNTAAGIESVVTIYGIRAPDPSNNLAGFLHSALSAAFQNITAIFTGNTTLQSSQNAGTFQPQAGAAGDPTVSALPAFTIGGLLRGNPRVGSPTLQIAAVAIFNSNISSSNAALYAAYKATLGHDLSLP